MEAIDMIPFSYEPIPEEDMLLRSQQHFAFMKKRRSIRMFSEKSVPKSVMCNIIESASTAPSGAHKQPWTFCLVGNSELKAKIRKAAEEEEYRNYHGRMSDTWLEDLKVFRTDWNKPFLEKAPWLIVIFKKPYDIINGSRQKNYYVNESLGIACGFLLNAIHRAGLVSLTHTPSPMNFLEKILGRPENERAYLLVPVGYPAENAEVPNLKRKEFHEICEVYE